MKKHCYTCAYKKEISGSAHFECIRKFTKATKPPEQNPYGVRSGWCMFPLNFDPVWLGKCAGFSKKFDKKKMRGKLSPLLELAAIFASVGR